MARLPARSKGALAHRAPESYVTRRVVLPAQDFIHRAGMSGVLLVISAAIAIAWANSPWQHSYHALWDTMVRISFGPAGLSKSLHHLVNDGLMAIFFFVVGLEIKRELLRGELSSVSRALMPLVGALGGMVVPALIYVGFNAGSPAVKGWGIPMATDIAFALGVLALLGNRIPSELRVLLLAIAIVDDIGSILVIAFFYTAKINFTALAIAFGLVGVVLLMRWLGFRTTGSYVVAGVLMWLAVLQSGVHATLAGVVLGALTPLKPNYSEKDFAEQLRDLQQRYRQALDNGDDEAAALALGRLEEVVIGTEPPLERAERLLHPWVAACVLPVFALANAGVSISPEAILGALRSPVAVGIAVGLVAGKFVGILGSCWLAAKTGIAKLPGRVTWPQVAGMSAAAGIGFTVALFIAALSFTDDQSAEHAKVGILFASLLSAAIGYAMLRAFGTRQPERRAAKA